MKLCQTCQNNKLHIRLKRGYWNQKKTYFHEPLKPMCEGKFPYWLWKEKCNYYFPDCDIQEEMFGEE